MYLLKIEEFARITKYKISWEAFCSAETYNRMPPSSTLSQILAHVFILKSYLVYACVISLFSQQATTDVLDITLLC